MKRIIFLSVAALLFSGTWHGFAWATDIELIVHEAECMKDGKMVIRYSIINTRDFDRPNVSICFKVMKDETPVAGRELRVVIPKKADGSQIYETIIKVPCKKEDYRLESTIFYIAKRYIIENWFAGCPGPWKSDGHDVLKKSVYSKDPRKK